MNRFIKITLPVLLLLILSWFTACNKNKVIIPDGDITFSVDTMMFDTVFTAMGTSTRSLKIYNASSSKIVIDRIRLEKGANSYFDINVNGKHGKDISEIKLAHKDSFHLFIRATIDPTNDDIPFIIEDNIIVEAGQHTFKLPVMAYGQNAYYIVDSLLQSDVWKSDKPYVIINSAMVDEGQTLTIPAGARIYMNADSRLFVLGSLKINGTQSDSVVFQGDRIDRKVLIGSYENLPGEWGGIYFAEQSHDNEINYAVFKNGGKATQIGERSTLGAVIQIDPDNIRNGIPKLKMTNSIIINSLQYGIVGFNSSLYAENCLVANCQMENVLLVNGGDYTLYDCSVTSVNGAKYFSKTRGHITAAIQNYYYTDQVNYTSNSLKLDIQNSLFFGNSVSEVEFFVDAKSDHPAEVSLSHCSINNKEELSDWMSLNQIYYQQNPEFINPTELNFKPAEGSPLIGKGKTAGIVNTDLQGNTRPNPPTIGCYEYEM